MMTSLSTSRFLNPVQNRSRFAKLSRPQRSVTCHSKDVDVQVFRFTLGIPGFDDAYIPRVVGGVGATLVALNHFTTSQPISDTQVRAEVIGLFLVLILVLLPSIEKSLNQAKGSIGRRASINDVAGSKNLFVFDTTINKDVAKSLAWVSYACLRNSTTCSILISWRKKVVLARGAFPFPADTTDKEEVLSTVSKDVASDQRLATIIGALPEEGIYMPTKSTMSSEGISKASCISEGIQSAFIIPLGTPCQGFIIALSDSERSLGSRDRSWLLKLSRYVETVCKELTI